MPAAAPSSETASGYARAREPPSRRARSAGAHRGSRTEGGNLQLVNLEGSVIFGPGSEWFWSMAQFVLVAVTLIGIYYQLRLARSANAFEQMNSIVDGWESERMTRHSLEVYLALREGVDLENIPEGAATSITNYLESVAALIRAGHVDRKLVYEFLGSR